MEADLKTGEHAVCESFITSDYYQFYKGLLTSTRLHQAARENGYRLQFVPHPVIRPRIGLFGKLEDIAVPERGKRYRDIFAESDLLVTDYSSVAFDFAWLKKPVLYAQFDKETVFNGEHTISKGYFSYEKDGFGEVEYDLESTVDRIIEYMENGCKLKDKYRDRIEGFFAFNDQHNCERVYGKLLELQGSINRRL